ncbi:MAG TPA: heparan-alpha-glucosaminide N-acetyltransferase domain-containing protein [Acholeplasmataceae bacterium]|nr:heparan-alpha-glucosaminide N-acetyltransferase domain-containing protein [Acholeplasmataceae bacterium]
MKKHYKSIDFLRGLGVFFVLMLHTAFYFYHDIYDVDLNNPSPIITIIGFLLMFAGLFAMISGMSYTIQFFHAHDQKKTSKRLKHMFISGLVLLIVAYLYFLFTGPGIINFESRMMDESLFVSLINQGYFQSLTLERIFYVDSLVMLSLNILLLSLFFKITWRYMKHHHYPLFVLLSAVIFLILSYIRIPLYLIYLNAVDERQFGLMILLNWFVAKNNPIFPFFAFALFGVWIACLIQKQNNKKLTTSMLSVGLTTLIIGVVGYILAPETMLERAIDPTWYFIMVIQIGLFILMILGALRFFDFKDRKQGPISTFISRFGIAGLTPFFFEQIISALIFFIINQFVTLELNIPGAILYGFILAISWGILLMIWERKQYRYGIEWMIGRIVSSVSPSSKSLKLEGQYD